MPYHIEREGNQYKVVVDATGRVVGTHPSKAQAQAQLGALYSNVPEAKKVEKQIITGGSGWKVEFSTPDCQHGWAIIKDGTGQSIGCYLTKEEAEKALGGLDNKGIDLLSEEVRTTKTPEEIKEDSMKKSFQSESFWSGIFVPEGEALSGVNYGTLYQDDRYYFPSESTYDKDGKPSAGYGNRSSNDSIR